ncbi:hypothetical protein ACFQ4O_03780 [Methylopila musalis]|uniref:Chromosome partition protein Smc n=1 Tax=Methylopila musalis TaxID=1134781 RepID=A0ABW3Z4B0_9HYPH
MTDLKASLTRARELHSENAKRISEMNERVAKRREELRANLHDLSPSEQSHILNRALGGLRADLKRDSADARTARLRELDALRRQAEDASAHYHSPMQMLMRESLGSERRSRLIQQLEHSGKVELASLAALAVSSKDRELAAVLASQVGRMPHGERPFSPHELADLLVGDEHRAIQAAIMEVGELTQRSLLDDRQFETGRPVDRVGLALRARDRSALGAAELPDEED